MEKTIDMVKFNLDPTLINLKPFELRLSKGLVKISHSPLQEVDECYFQE